ncbi:hypothetical protein [Salibacterium halotolerans]|uniref:Uncharacterized protein n=1 Tax=Salibacterium halotolerans TaxID=1884432 RepID=A0A1I5LGX5_9BACI|nr:hypothetical protein [Salibacterium halotolerans]SFO96086.1 hypothetical protein SAMN05518683_101227 [Salibacterium halotolerans]
MLWNKKGNYLLASVLSIGMLGAVPGMAAAEQDTAADLGTSDQASHEEAGLAKEQNNSPAAYPIKRSMKTQDLEHYAQELGIDTGDKNIYELADEVKEVAVKQRAKELGIATLGKNLDTLTAEVREAVLTERAVELGINIRDKKMSDLVQEVRNQEQQIDAEPSTLKENLPPLVDEEPVSSDRTHGTRL